MSHNREIEEGMKKIADELARRLNASVSCGLDVRLEEIPESDTFANLVAAINNMATVARKNLEETEQRNRKLQDRFLSNMSHEIRTPLTAILGFSELVNSYTVSEDERRSFGLKISNNAKHLLNLINEILDFSKIELGQFVVEPTEFSLVDLVQSATGLFESQFDSKSLRLDLSFAPELTGRIVTDSPRLQQIIINLISNAVKFTEAGAIHIACKAIKARDKDMLQIEVTDSGIGIPADVKPNLFSPFTQADMSLTRKYGSTGLGLALSKRIANALGGDLELSESHVGRGSKFTLTVPVALQGTKNKVQSAPPGAKRDKDQRLQGVRVLLAEDSPDNQILFKWFLEKSSADVTVASDGLEALSLINPDVDLVLMDIQMPNMDGYEATRRLRALGFERPILALTAHAHDRDLEPIMAAGCDGRITKPVTQNELVRRILERLNRTNDYKSMAAGQT